MCLIPTNHDVGNTHRHAHTHTKLFSCYGKLDWVISLISFEAVLCGSLVVSPKPDYMLWNGFIFDFFYCFWFPLIVTMKDPCIFHLEMGLCRCFTQVCVNIGGVGYKVKLHSSACLVPWQDMSNKRLSSFLKFCLQGWVLVSVCGWKINHFWDNKD